MGVKGHLLGPVEGFCDGLRENRDKMTFRLNESCLLLLLLRGALF